MLMNVLYEMQPWVVQATRPNIYNQERTIMNNTRIHVMGEQRSHGPFLSVPVGHSLRLNGSFIEFGTVLIPYACIAAVE